MIWWDRICLNVEQLTLQIPLSLSTIVAKIQLQFVQQVGFAMPLNLFLVMNNINILSLTRAEQLAH